MSTGSNNSAVASSIVVTLLAQVDDTGRTNYYSPEGVAHEIQIERIRDITAYTGPFHNPALEMARSTIWLTPQNAFGAAAVSHLNVSNDKSALLANISAAKMPVGYRLATAPSPMSVEPMKLSDASSVVHSPLSSMRKPSLSKSALSSTSRR